MKLEKVERLHFQVLQAALHEGRQVFPGIAARYMRIEPAPGLGGDVKGLASFPAKPGQQLFTAPIAVDIGCVEEIHAQVEGAVQCGK